MSNRAEIRTETEDRNVIPAVWILFVIYIVLSQIVTQILNVGASRLSGIILLTPVALMLAVFLTMAMGGLVVEFSFYHKYILCFGLFCLASSLWAQSPALALSKGIDIIEIFMIMMVVSFCFQKTDCTDSLLKAIMWAYYAVVFYEIAFYGWRYFLQVVRESSRVTSEYLNSNTLGMCAAFAVLIQIYLLFSKKIPVWTLVSAAVGVFVIVASGSRKALAALFIGGFLYFILPSFRKGQGSISFLRLLFLLPLILFAIYMVLRQPVFSGVMERFAGMIGTISGDAVEKSTVQRLSLMQLGMRLFKENPLLGVGIDNPRLYTYDVVGETFYLHNNYIEILAAGGLIGFIIYYGIYVKLIFSYIKHRMFGDPQYCVCFVLLILTMIMDFGMVSYYSKSTFVFLMLFVKYSEKLTTPDPEIKRSY